MNFIEKVKAVLTGDDVALTAGKIQKKAKTLVAIEISNIKNTILRKEDEVENLSETYEQSKMNFGSKEFNDEEFVQTIVSCYNSLEKAREDLEQLQAQEEFLNRLLEEIS